MTDVRTPEAGQGAPGAHGRRRGRGAAAARPGTGSFGVLAWARWVWRQLTSMRIALVLLFLLALGSVPGSLLPQQGIDPAAVQQYYTAHPALAPVLNGLGLFNVFAAPWFAAIYLLLFISLAGCVLPRAFRLIRSARALPPRAPRHLSRLPNSARYETSMTAGEAAAAAATFLRRRRFRLNQGDGWLSAEKGYRREVGNLLFHIALIGVLVSIGVGGLFGYKADRLMVEGSSFADTVTDLDAFHPGHLVSAADLAPFSLTLNKFSASYILSGPDRGPAEQLHRERLLYGAARRRGPDLQPRGEPPAQRGLDEGVPDRPRLRPGLPGDRRAGQGRVRPGDPVPAG